MSEASKSALVKVLRDSAGLSLPQASRAADHVLRMFPGQQVVARCPFCTAAPNLTPQRTYNAAPSGDFRKAMWCEGRGSFGPERDTDEAAIDAWNERRP